MFTGIIEEVGTVRSIQKKNYSLSLTISADKIMQDLRAGDSIAVNGICLTAKAFTDSAFTADVMHETLERTSFAGLKAGSRVNLERAMQLNGRFGGHIVTGHIDGTGTITGIKKDGIAVLYTISTEQKILKRIIEKGSVAVDGISLTVAKVTNRDFCVSVIPHTAENTILASRRVHETVNLENDCIGKYIEKFISCRNGRKSGITRAFLAEAGYQED